MTDASVVLLLTTFTEAKERAACQVLLKIIWQQTVEVLIK